ncbi:hypothetical protein BN2537_11403 [Streptomyces venezuelae]|nr:hypothetical protein BN2537_11403 [Streptomyces venezuelae]
MRAVLPSRSRAPRLVPVRRHDHACGAVPPSGARAPHGS